MVDIPARAMHETDVVSDGGFRDRRSIESRELIWASGSHDDTIVAHIPGDLQNLLPFF